MTVRKLITKNAAASFLLSALVALAAWSVFGDYLIGYFKNQWVIVPIGYYPSRYWNTILASPQAKAGSGFLLDVIAVLSVLILAPLAVWLVFRIWSLINYKKHPSYKKFSLLPENTAENEKTINSRLSVLRAERQRLGKIIKIEGWEIERGLFRTRISVAEPPKRSYEL